MDSPGGTTGRAGRRARLAFGALALADTALAGSNHRAARRLRYLTKPLLMPALATGFTASTAGRRDVLRTRTLAAHACSWGGDVALLGCGERAFLTGVGSFFAAHVGYLCAFLGSRDRYRHRGGRLRPGPTAAAVSWLALAPVMALAAGRKDAKLRAPIAVYASALAGMFATSTTLDRRLPSAARRKVVLGTSLFLLSDSVLGVREFLREDDSPALDAVVMATYTAGQWLIADGVAAARP